MSLSTPAISNSIHIHMYIVVFQIQLYKSKLCNKDFSKLLLMKHNKLKQNILEYAGILLQMKMRASASLMKKRKPFSPKPINNLSNEVSKRNNAMLIT